MTTAAPNRERITTNVATDSPLELWLAIVLFLVISAGMLLRFVDVDGKVCWYDECFSRMRVAGYGRPELAPYLLAAQKPIPVGEALSFMHWRFDSKEPVPYKAVLSEDFQNSALYYWSARVWVGLFGESAASLRYYSILGSLLCLPLLFSLCIELFGSRRTAWITAGIMASAPVFVLYAQQIRNYDIWNVTVLLAGLTLLRATRRNGFWDWAAYSVSLLLSILASPLSIPVAVGHAAFVAIRARFQFVREVKAFLLCGLVASLAFVPRVIFHSYDVIMSYGLGWLGVPPKGGLQEYLWAPIKNISRVFAESASLGGNPMVCAAAIAVFSMAIFALVQMYRHASRDQRLFVFCLLFPSYLALVARDAITLGRSATVTRYLFPSLIGVVIAVGYLFNRMTLPKIGQNARLVTGLWSALLVLLLTSALISSARIISKPVSWASWPEVSATVPECAALVNKVVNPVVVIPWQGRATIPLVLGQKLNSDAIIIPVDDEAPQWKSMLQRELDAGRSVFLWDPIKLLSPELREHGASAFTTLKKGANVGTTNNGASAGKQLNMRCIDSKQVLWTLSLKPYKDADREAGRTPAN